MDKLQITLKNIELIIISLIVGLLSVYVIIGYTNKGVGINTNSITNNNIKIDSILYYLKNADSLNKVFRSNAFYIAKDSVNIDKNGYFYSCYHKKYKLTK